MFKGALTLLPLLVLYTRPISASNQFLRVTFYDILVVFLLIAVVYLRHQYPLKRRGRDWAMVGLAYFLVIAIVLAKEPDFLRAIPSIGGLILGAAALFVVIEHPSRFVATRLVNVWLVGLGLTALVAVGQTAGPGRAIGLFRFPNELGTYGVATVALFLAAHYFKLTSGPRIAAGLAGSGVVLLASGGRAAIVSAAVLLALYSGLYVLSSSHNFAKAVSVVVPIIILTILLTSTASFNITETIAESAGVSSRRVVESWEQRQIGTFFVENWEDSWALFRASPGIGLAISEATVDSSTLGGEYSVHNTPLSLLVNYGLVGVALLATPILLLRRNHLFPPTSFMLVLVVGMLPLILYHDVAESRSVWLALAIIARASWDQRQELAYAQARERAAEEEEPAMQPRAVRRQLRLQRRLRY